VTFHWASDENVPLLTDLYELHMMQAYRNQGMNGIAVFDLFMRRIPATRNYLVACGLEDILHYLETLRFSDHQLAYLRSLNHFSPEFMAELADFRFSGDVWAVPEGTVFFANEPVLEIIAPIVQAQLVESFILNQLHIATLAASKAARVVTAAKGKTVVDFGLRRMHGADAALKAARAFYIAGVTATSNVLAGELFGIPVSGTMAHSYVQAHSSEYEAFVSFLRTVPEAYLLVDTYDTLEGVRQVIRVARNLPDLRIAGIRLDSGDLTLLSKASREILDNAGLTNVRIFVSGDLDEHEVARMMASGAPIDGFGVGTRMGVSSDAPYLDSVYKLVEYDGKPRSKRSTGKRTLPGRKQIFREVVEGKFTSDVIGLSDEALPGTPQLQLVMKAGRRTSPPPALSTIREYCREQLQSLQSPLLQLSPCATPYPVSTSPGLEKLSSII
jgi:nicotinate phosphoribosyltransferase